MSYAPFGNIFRRVTRAPVNPLDKSTIVSIYPRAIDENKPTIQPGNFRMEAGSYEAPSTLIVGPSSWWKELDEDQPMLEIPVSSIQIADSVVRDYCNGLLACDMGDIMPGMFYIPGEWTSSKIKSEKKSLVENALAKQRRWYAALVKIGDVMWSRTNGNPLAVSDDMRLAARELNLQKEWIKDFQNVELIRCKACGNLNNSLIVVCPNCKVILNPEEFRKLGLAFAS